MQNFVFFTMNNFQKEGGGTIRMLGIINELAKVNPNVTLISNIHDRSKVHASVKHVSLDYTATAEEKRRIQFLLGLFGYRRLNRNSKILLDRLNNVFREVNKDSRFVFFEYLDNSIGYWLKMNDIIGGYTNDVHGIARNEFAFQAKKASTVKARLMFRLKKAVSEKLDKKVFENADGIFYASEAMYQYFKDLYPVLAKKRNLFLPYVLNPQNVKPADPETIKKFKNELQITDRDFVFLFAGAYKETGGIQDLIQAFDTVAERHINARLLLVGDGPTYQQCRGIADALQHKDRISFLGRQPYDDLTSFQEMAHVLVCPDRQNLFSDLIVHVKYLDALVSGKLVINGSFKSVMEINRDQQLSLLFKPSDIGDLAATMIDAIENYEDLNQKFVGSKEYTLNHLTYKNFIGNLIEKNDP